MHLANLLSLAMFLGFVAHLSLVEAPRQQVIQLDPANVSYCELSQCPRIQGLELTNAATALENLDAKDFGAQLSLDFTNHELLQGERELWLRVETADGRILEMASATITFDLKNRTIAEFLLVSDIGAILDSRLLLGY
jgi:hypothetical protein